MKERLDRLLVKKNMAPSRERARAYIMEGAVYVNGQKEVKAGSLFSETDAIVLKNEAPRYVSRGGKKLAKALAVFPLELSGRVCLDVGASTGGFTDCMLQHNAAKVYAVDVGYGQLAWKLRNDSRVVVMERTNARYLSPEVFKERPEVASVDVSFISLTKVLPSVAACLTENGKILCLIKPQFEAGREQVKKKGVVRDPKVHVQVIEAVLHFAKENALCPLGVTYSPIKGPEGNIEYLLYLTKGEAACPSPSLCAEAVALEAHQVLNGKETA